jgi:tetratricopeptide (TPR) repeat protein
MSTAAVNSPAPGSPWLFGRGSDLLVGCGLAYLLFIPVLLIASDATGVTDWPPFLVMALGLLTSTPHYGATILRVYQTREDRRRYAFFASYLTIGLALLLVIAAHNVWLASLLITVYFSWSPWHFSGQNYGLALVFLRKRGIEIDATTKRLIYASFVLSAALAIMAIHGGRQDGVLSPDTLAVANSPRLLLVPGVPEVAPFVLPLVLLGYLGSLGAVAWRLASRARLRTLAPALLLVISQALWFVLPLMVATDAAGGWDLIFASVWFSTAHAAQYLWVTAYYEKSSGRSSSVASFLWKSLLAGTALLFLPAFVLAPDLLGELPFDVGLAAVIFATVNIHHFILDGAIWKLRDGRVARILLRDPDQAALPTAPQARTSRAWIRRLIWGVAGACFVAQLMNYFATALIADAKDSQRYLSAARINRWIGRETVAIQFEIGRRLASEGDRQGAIEHLRRSIALFPTAGAWVALGKQYQAEGEVELAIAAFEAATAVDSRAWAAHYERAVSLIAKASQTNSEPFRREAIRSLERALEIRPGHPGASQLLARVQHESGRRDEALGTPESPLDPVDPTGARPIRSDPDELEPGSEGGPRKG